MIDLTELLDELPDEYADNPGVDPEMAKWAMDELLADIGVNQRVLPGNTFSDTSLVSPSELSTKPKRTFTSVLFELVGRFR